MWAIERASPERETIRLVFNGSRKQAATETARLNALARIPPNFRAWAFRRPIELGLRATSDMKRD
jgi:hypothetical protein